MNRKQDIIDDALAGFSTGHIAYCRNISQQQVRKVLRIERARRRVAGEPVPQELHAGPVKVETTRNVVPRERLRENFRVCATLRVEPRYAELAKTFGISVRSVRREHQEWRASGYVVQPVPLTEAACVPADKPNGPVLHYIPENAPGLLDKPVTRPGLPSKGPLGGGFSQEPSVLSGPNAMAEVVPKPERVTLPQVPARIPVIDGYQIVPDDAARLPNQKEVLIFAAILFTLLAVLLSFFAPGA